MATLPEWIEARVIQKIATEAEWNAITLVPYKGEFCIVGDNSGKVYNIKVGDGINTFPNLEYMFDSIQQNVGYIAIESNALPTPLDDVAWGMVTGGTYTFGGSDVFTVPEGHWGIANYSSGAWSLVDMGSLPDNSAKVQEYSLSKIYNSDEQVRFGGNIYISLQNNNLGNEPSHTRDTEFWKLYVDSVTLNKIKHNSQSTEPTVIDWEDYNVHLGYINQNGAIINPAVDSGWARHAPIFLSKGQTIRVVSIVDSIDSQPALIIYSSAEISSATYIDRAQLPLSGQVITIEYTMRQDAYVVSQFKRTGNETIGQLSIVGFAGKLFVDANAVDKQGGVASYELNQKIVNNSKYGRFYDDSSYFFRKRLYVNNGVFTTQWTQDWKGTDLIPVDPGDLVEITATPGANTSTPVGWFFDENAANPQPIVADVAGQVSIKSYTAQVKGYIVAQYRRATIDGIGKVSIYTDGNKEKIFGDGGGDSGSVGFASSNKTEFNWTPKGVMFTAADMEMNTVYWPYVIETSKIEDALGKYYMYFSTDHEPEVSGIFMAYSDRLDGGWNLYGKLIGINQEGVTTEVETPTVIWDEIANEFRMYVQTHGGSEDPLGYSQYTTIFSSVDGVNWTWVKRALSINNNDFLMGDGHNGYFHIVKAGGMYVANHLTGGTGISHSSISYSYDGLNWLTDRNQYNVQMHASFNNNVWGSSMQGAFFEIKGKIYSLAGTGQSASGNIPKNHFLGLTELGSDFRTQIGYTRKVADLENPDIRSVSAFYNSEDGLVYVYYVVNDGIYLGTFKITE